MEELLSVSFEPSYQDRRVSVTANDRGFRRDEKWQGDDENLVNEYSDRGSAWLSLNLSEHALGVDVSSWPF